ncbi:CotH kinase family protein [Limosilactobacillus vaginalis]|uniref:CotH kinase family protein n=1 Tax=Limosilactobacillus vaginalis TaxID=1633 RepID=UPI0024BA12E6|nr:CotH kinase family protein [Limosilactobacillus vaginalis]
MRVIVDLMKKSTQIIDLSNVINPRVGDDDLLLPLHICYGDNLFDMRGKDVEFLSNDPNKKNIYIAGTCNTNTPGDNLYMGDLTFRFPAGTFQAEGTYDPDKTMFRIVDKETQKVISSVNVKITVMKNAIEFNFDPDKSSYDSRLETMLHDFHDKGQAMLDDIKDLNDQAKSNVSGDTAATAKEAKQQADTNAGDISDLKGEVAGARGRYADLPGREDAQDTAIRQKESIVNANANYAAVNLRDDKQDIAIATKASQHFITDYLSHLNLNPTAYRSLDELSQKYPDGDERLAVVSNKNNTFFAYWDPATKAWTQGANLVDPDKIHFDEILASFQNYIPNPSFNGIEMPGTSGTVTQKIIKKYGQNWLHFENTGIGGIYWLFDPKMEENSYFPNADKQFSATVVNNDSKTHLVEADIHITNADNGIDTVILPGVSVEALPGKPTTIQAKFNVSSNKPFINNNYQMFVYDQTGNGSFDLKDPVLSDFYRENTTDFDGLVNSKSIPEPLEGSKVDQISYMNQEMYHLILDDAKFSSENETPKECGIKWQFHLSDTAYVDQTPLKINLPLINRNSYKAQKINLVYQELNDDGSTDFEYQIGSWVLLPNTSLIIDKTFSFALNKAHHQGKLVVTADDAKNVDLYISANMFLQHMFNTTKGDNLFGNFLTSGHGYWGGKSSITEFHGQQALKVELDGKQGSPSILLPISNPTKDATYKAKFTFASDDDLTLYFNIKNYDQDLNVHGTIANFGNSTLHLKAGEVKTFTGTYTANDIQSLFQALQIFTLGQGGTIYLLDAQMHLLASEDDKDENQKNIQPVSQSSGNVLPLFNLKTEFINGGSSLSKGKVTITRDNHTEEHFATFRIQGNSSTLYPKKSWRITFYQDDSYSEKQDVNIFPDYAPVNAINMKANWIDWTQANNLLISRYVSELSLLTASDLAKEQVEAWSQGQITGEPVLGFNNDKPLGLFTISPKKSNTMFNMDKKSTTQAVFQGGVYSDATEFKADSAEYIEAKDFSIEGPDDDVAQPLKDSFNSLLKLTNSGTDDEFKAQISSKINLRSIANWIVMTMLFGIEDEAAKNIMFATWDGQKWNAMQYDHDLAMGIDFQAQTLKTSANSFNLTDFMSKNKLIQRLIHLHLIDNLLIDSFNKFASMHSFLSLQKDYRKYMYHVGATNYDYNEEIWPDMPGRKYFNADHVMDYLRERYTDCQTWFTKTYLGKL